MSTNISWKFHGENTKTSRKISAYEFKEKETALIKSEKKLPNKHDNQIIFSSANISEKFHGENTKTFWKNVKKNFRRRI